MNTSNNERVTALRAQKNLKQRWTNSGGQIAIFLALIFQVLFVFFAMSVNVAMIVYQKVNLQNAVDLAAYYGAMKQAEVLNTIAHMNFQIRQNYKLMSWRFRVLGDFGRQLPMRHPGNMLNPNRFSEPDALYSPSLPSLEYEPAVCIAHNAFANFSSSNQSLCLRQETYNVPVFQVPNVGIDIFGIGTLARNLFTQAQSVVVNNCNESGRYNWLYGATVMYIYRADQRDRRQWIQTLAQSITSDSNDFFDLDGNLASEGMRKTLFKNLSKSNQKNFNDQMVVFNSMGQGAKKWFEWLQPIPVAIRGKYTYNEGTITKCSIFQRELHKALPEHRLGATGNQQTADLLFSATEDIGLLNQDFITNDWSNVIGFEKNPWMMAYVGVTAQTQPLRLFSPFGSEVTLTARAFAKPFGGRIGPWYKTTWSPTSPRSDNIVEVDPLLPIHGAEYNKFVSGAATAEEKVRLHPNHARFPGDRLGLKSRMALTMIEVNPPFEKPNLLHIINAINEYQDYSKSRDPLAWDWANEKPPLQREWEKAAIAPDLFDATYYSVDTNYMDSTYARLIDRRKSRPNSLPLLPAEQQFPPADLGSHFGNVSGIGAPLIVSVKDFVHERVTRPDYNQYFQRYFWQLSDWRHLLTAWASHREGDYATFPSDFANCRSPARGKSPPFLQDPKNLYTGCALGGRSGYSIKLVSKDYLNSDAHALGGTSTGSKIKNPPAEWPNP